MKANEFVKKFGWDEVKRIVSTYTNATHVIDDARLFINDVQYKKHCGWFADSLDSMVTFNDLKRLVESHELVQSYGGVDIAKNCEYTEDLDRVIYNVELAKAILDVESCQ